MVDLLKYKVDSDFYSLCGKAAWSTGWNRAIDLALTLPVEEIMSHRIEEPQKAGWYPEEIVGFNKALKLAYALSIRESQSSNI